MNLAHAAALDRIADRIISLGKGRFMRSCVDVEDGCSLTARYAPEERNLRVLIRRRSAPPCGRQRPLKYSARNVQRLMAQASIDRDFFVLGEADKIAHLLQLSGFTFVDGAQSVQYGEYFEVVQNCLQFACGDHLVSVEFEARRTAR